MTPDLSTLSLPELRALNAALLAAIRAAGAVPPPDFTAALMADAEGVSVVFTIPISQTDQRVMT